jgi:hypothetical protein
VDLYIENELMGDWAISGRYALFTIGATDRTGAMSATFDGYAVTLYYVDTNVLYLQYRETSGVLVEYYVFVYEDEARDETVLLLSETSTLRSEYIVCSRVNELFGEWTYNANKKMSIKFDGVSSYYQNGIAVIANAYGSTNYYYTYKNGGILLWTQETVAGGKTLYYRIEFADLTANPDAINDSSAFVKDGKAFFRTEVDGLCLTLATDTETEERYLFDGLCLNNSNGGIWVGNEKKYEYTYIVYNANQTATLTVIDVATGKTYTATLNYADSNNVTFTLGEEVVS